MAFPIDSDSNTINAVNFTQQSSDPAAPAASHYKLYFKSAGLYFENSSSSVTGPLAAGITPYYCRVRNSANISIPTGAFTAMTFDTEDFDNDTMHSTVTNPGRITFTHAGIYRVTANIQLASSAVGSNRALEIRLNGTTVIAEVNLLPAATLLAECLSTIYSFSAADYVEALVFQDSGGGLNVNTQTSWSPCFSAERVG